MQSATVPFPRNESRIDGAIYELEELKKKVRVLQEKDGLKKFKNNTFKIGWSYFSLFLFKIINIGVSNMTLHFDVQCLFCDDKFSAESNKEEYEFNCQNCKLNYILTYKFLRFNPSFQKTF